MKLYIFIISILVLASCVPDNNKNTTLCDNLKGKYDVSVEKETIRKVLKKHRLDERYAEMANMMVDVKIELSEAQKGVLTVDAGMFNGQLRGLDKPIEFEYEIKNDSLVYGRLKGKAAGMRHVGTIKSCSQKGKNIELFINKNRYLADGAVLTLKQ